MSWRSLKLGQLVMSGLRRWNLGNASRGDRTFLAVWSVGLLLLLLCTGWLAIIPVRRERVASAVHQQAYLDPLVADAGATTPEFKLPAGSTPTRVTVGIYVDRIVALSIKDASWTVDFYVWFAWKGDSIQPGDGFQIIDGKIESQEK